MLAAPRLLVNFVRSAALRAVSPHSTAIQGSPRLTDVEPQKYRRDLATLEEFETVNHNMTGVYDYSINTPESVIFGANTSCILAPEVTDGP